MNRSLATFALLLAPFLAATVASARTYVYDQAGRLTLAIYEDGNAIQYVYTKGNNIREVIRLMAPAAPSDLSVVRDFETRARLEWDDNSTDETGFTLQRRTANSSDWQTIATLGSNATSYDDNSLKSTLNYVYRVYANTGQIDLHSAYSDSVAASGEGSIAFSITSIDVYDPENSLFLIHFQSQSGSEYQLQVSSSHEPGTWVPYPWRSTPDGVPTQSNISGQAGQTSIYVFDSIQDKIYFRIVYFQ